MSADILPNRVNNASLKELLINKQLKNGIYTHTYSMQTIIQGSRIRVR